MQTLTIALFTEVVTEWIGPEESDQGVELSNSVLQRCTGETPLVLRVERKSSFGGIGRSFFDIVRFVKDHPTSMSFPLAATSQETRLTCAIGTSGLERPP